ncbi:MAG TPA: malate dehydrogenase, partial [Planctomycetaceae bacterium]|nr:malate dehydrogenase [Planctomycetaceae bacterium]
MRFAHQPLRDVISAVFSANESNETEARLVGDHLVEANLAGHDSHGVIRTPIYIEWLRAGDVV